MSKKLRKREIDKHRSATEVEIQFTVDLKEIHSRTRTLCDERLETFSFTLENDFQRTAAWLGTDAAETVFDELSGEIGHYVALKSRGGR
jgi:hypothetical protein